MTPITHKIVNQPPLANAAPRISSFDQNPDSGNTPLIASQAIAIVTKVVGMYFLRPPIFHMSCWFVMAWMIEPAARNRRALKKAWVMRWKMNAVGAVRPTAMIMYPSWLIVEYARTRLMSRWPTARVAANSAVRAPTIATMARVTGASSKMAAVRAIM